MGKPSVNTNAKWQNQSLTLVSFTKKKKTKMPLPTERVLPPRRLERRHHRCPLMSAECMVFNLKTLKILERRRHRCPMNSEEWMVFHLQTFTRTLTRTLWTSTIWMNGEGAV